MADKDSELIKLREYISKLEEQQRKLIQNDNQNESLKT